MADAMRRPTRGFTLIELAVVMVIIGILISLILVAAQGGVRRAEERATQALLLKLDTGLSERIEAFLSMPAEPNPTHEAMAAVYRTTAGAQPLIPGPQRAAVIAQFDMMRAEFPDVFLVVAPGSGGYTATAYPLNFAARPYPLNGTGNAAYLLPLGAGVLGTGIHGASYAAAAGVYKNLGYLPKGYDTVDNDRDGLVDEYDEGVDTTNSDLVNDRLAAHQHKTARSEMLYAILVEGQGPLGSSFSADDFTDREVRDTDGDGLPEFIDAWGEPLQFYRWPIFFHSDQQKGYFAGPTGGPYNGPIEAREQDPLDPNQQLVAPAWWSFGANYGPDGTNFPRLDPVSGGVVAFQTYFHTLVEPLSSGAPSSSFWSRGTSTTSFPQRRAYYSKFLIASSGPDLELGIAQVGKDYDASPAPTKPYNDNGVTGTAAAPNVVNVLIEGQAAQATLFRSDAVYLTPQTDAGNAKITTSLQEAGLDDVTNHSIFSAGGGVQ